MKPPPLPKIKVCVAGATGWTGSVVTRALLGSDRFQLVGAVARREAGRDVGEVLGLHAAGVPVTMSLAEAVARAQPDVLVDYTKPDSVKARVLEALDAGIHVVIGTSGLDAADYATIGAAADRRGLGVVAAGNFSLTAALAKHFALFAAQHLPKWEIVDYAHADKVDAPSGTTRELAEALAAVRPGGGKPVHSLRLDGYVIAFETIFGLKNERLSIRHDAGSGAEPYVNGTLLAVQKVMETRGLVRGLDTLLFGAHSSSTMSKP